MTYTEIYDSWLNDKRLNAEGRKELENIKDSKEEIEYTPHIGTCAVYRNPRRKR